MDLLVVATLIAALGSGLVAGVFYAFSTFVMAGLGRVAPDEGARAMQAINETVLTPWFLGVFVGLAPLCIGLGVVAVLNWGEPGTGWLLAGGLTYLLGTFAETPAVHIPMNDRLAELDADHEEGQAYWAHYLVRWTRWNHVRTAAALVAAGLFTGALMA